MVNRRFPPPWSVEEQQEAGANGLTFPEIIEAAFPGLDDDECLRLAAILEHATTGKMPVYTSIN